MFRLVRGRYARTNDKNSGITVFRKTAWLIMAIFTSWCCLAGFHAIQQFFKKKGMHNIFFN